MNVGNVWFLAFLGPNELSVIERCPYYRGVLKERLDCIWMILVMGIPWFSDALIRRGNFYCSVIFEGCYMLDHYEMNFFFSLTSVDSWDSFSLSFSMKKLQTPDKSTTRHDLINCEFCQCLSQIAIVRIQYIRESMWFSYCCLCMFYIDWTTQAS